MGTRFCGKRCVIDILTHSPPPSHTYRVAMVRTRRSASAGIRTRPQFWSTSFFKLDSPKKASLSMCSILLWERILEREGTKLWGHYGGRYRCLGCWERPSSSFCLKLSPCVCRWIFENCSKTRRTTLTICCFRDTTEYIRDICIFTKIEWLENKYKE